MLDQRRHDAVAWLTFDRPDRLNSFTVADYRDLRLALEGLAHDASANVVVLTGRGRAFSAGADRSLLDGTAEPDELEKAGEEFTGLLEILGSFDKPLLAAVNGVGVGFGCTLLLYCDFVLIAESARLRLPFTALGILPEAGSSALLPLRTRWADAMWKMLSSEWIDAETAHRMGLAWRVVPDPDLIELASSAATDLAALDSASVAATKRLMVAGRADIARRAIRREMEEMRALRLSEGN